MKKIIKHSSSSLAVLFAVLCLSGCASKKRAQQNFDKGYVLGQSDAIKRQYWLRQAMEREKRSSSDEGEVSYISVPGPVETEDGKQLEPHDVVVRVVK